MMTPPTIMIGEEAAMRQAMSTSICTCWTSLVPRVISEGAPNWSTSRWENVPTRWNRSRRTSRPNDIAVREPNQAAPTDARTWAKETASMMAPRWKIVPVSPSAMPSSMIRALRLGR